MAEDVSRRERNKQEKLRRITQAAQELFAERGEHEITTQQIADRADVATGTLFLYARNKGELLLLAQNASYARALELGTTAAGASEDACAAVMAIVEEIVACNREHAANGRSYLREMMFGDPTEPHHAEALRLSRSTELAIVSCLSGRGRLDAARAAAVARIITAIMFLAMASPLATNASAERITEDIRRQVSMLMTAQTAD
nr:hypothetical protein GCM10020063_039710 [Dactylosporangium thailandense]